MISLTITSCKRPDLFIKTFTSLKSKCLDIDLVDEIVWADDNSSGHGFLLMENCIRELFPKTKILSNHREFNPGQAVSLNWILSTVTNQYALHIEDDMIFERPHFMIMPSLFIMKEFSHIKQVLLNERKMFSEFQTSNGTKFTVWERGIALDSQEVKHCGYSLQPTVTDLKYFKDKCEGYNATGIESSFVKEYDNGIRTACLDGIKLIHLGVNCSSFSLNDTPR